MPGMPPKAWLDLHSMGVVHEPSSVLEMDSESFLELEKDVVEERRAPPSDTSSVDPLEDSCHGVLLHHHKKTGSSVSFDALHIREYSQVLGDHPCCTMGPPLSLGWDVKDEKHVSVDEYEATRTRRRTRDDLRLSGESRREILADYSDGDVRRAQRRLHRDRNYSDKALGRFFHTSDNNKKKEETANE